MAEASTCVKIFQFLAVLLFIAYFCFQCYEIYSGKDKYASKFYSAYGQFESWWNKNFKRTIMNEFAYTMPDQKELYPYKAKVTMFMGYFWAFGSLWLVTGDTTAALLLLPTQIIHSAVTHGPI